MPSRLTGPDLKKEASVFNFSTTKKISYDYKRDSRATKCECSSRFRKNTEQRGYFSNKVKEPLELPNCILNAVTAVSELDKYWFEIKNSHRIIASCLTNTETFMIQTKHTENAALVKAARCFCGSFFKIG